MYCDGRHKVTLMYCSGGHKVMLMYCDGGYEVTPMYCSGGHKVTLMYCSGGHMVDPHPPKIADAAENFTAAENPPRIFVAGYNLP